MKFPEEFLNEMNDFFSRYKYVPQEGFFESFEKEPLKGIRFSSHGIKHTIKETNIFFKINGIIMICIIFFENFFEVLIE